MSEKWKLQNVISSHLVKHFLTDTFLRACYLNTLSLFICLFIFQFYAQAQELKISPRVYFKMSGSINLQLNNAGFNNNGNVETDVSTVKFSGNADTTTTYIKGTAASTFII